MRTLLFLAALAIFTIVTVAVLALLGSIVLAGLWRWVGGARR